jgi:hypothetical protein
MRLLLSFSQTSIPLKNSSSQHIPKIHYIKIDHLLLIARRGKIIGLGNITEDGWPRWHIAIN